MIDTLNESFRKRLMEVQQNVLSSHAEGLVVPDIAVIPPEDMDAKIVGLGIAAIDPAWADRMPALLVCFPPMVKATGRCVLFVNCWTDDETWMVALLTWLDGLRKGPAGERLEPDEFFLEAVHKQAREHLERIFTKGSADPCPKTQD